MTGLAGCGSHAVTHTGSSTFLGRFSNGAVLIQWTRSGNSLSGSVDQSLFDTSSQSMDQETASFSGTIAGNGLTLTLNQGLGSTKALVGTIHGSDFVLTYPGENQALVQIGFKPSSVAAYNTAVQQVQTEEETPTTPAQLAPSTSGYTPVQPSQSCLQSAGTLSVVVFHQFCGIKPSGIGVSADGGNIITGINWSSWTATSATGVGTSDIQSCVPDCADGTDTPVTTTVSFSQPEDGLFEKMTEVRQGKTTSYLYYNESWPYSATK